MIEYKLINCRGKGNLWVKPYAKIHSSVKVHGKAYVDTGTSINERVELYGGEIHIGKYCAIARDVKFQGINHDITKSSQCFYFYRLMFDDLELERPGKPIIICNDVWIGTQVVILPGVTIGDGAIVGAGSIVTKDIKPYSISAGIPAKHIKWRFPKHIIKQLIDIKWWDWSMDKIKRNKSFFSVNLKELDGIYKLIK